MSVAWLPDAERAFVAAEKVRDYLLDPAHPDNGGKAEFFFRFGYTRETWTVLRSALLAHALRNSIAHIDRNERGTRFRVRCSLPSPDGRDPCIVTVWIIEQEDVPRLLTAFPGPPSG